jgi:hypothetical protein
MMAERAGLSMFPTALVKLAGGETQGQSRRQETLGSQIIADISARRRKSQMMMLMMMMMTEEGCL